MCKFTVLVEWLEQRGHWLVLEDALWLLLEEEEKLALLRRLPPPVMLIRGRLDGITARDKGGGGGGTRDGYEYTLRIEERVMNEQTTAFTLLPLGYRVIYTEQKCNTCWTHISWAEINPRNFPYAQNAPFSHFVQKFVYIPVGENFSFDNIIHPPDSCGISKSWLHSIVTLVHLVLGTIKIH
jgi:hypothetical protein